MAFNFHNNLNKEKILMEIKVVKKKTFFKSDQLLR